MRSYRPGSWSKIAREVANRQIEQYFYYTKEYTPSENTILNDAEWLKEVTDVNSYIKFISNLDRNDLIKRRALKRFIKVMKRKGVM